VSLWSIGDTNQATDGRFDHAIPEHYNEFIGGGTSEKVEEAGVVLAVRDGENSPGDAKEKAGKQARGG
jgi:hypothetical protein